MTRYKPSRPVAVLTALVGIGMLAFALTSMGGANVAFLVFWCVVVVAVVGLNLWAAFARNGSLYTSKGTGAPPS